MNDKKYILPYGDVLREFLSDSNVLKSDLKSILRGRGVFTANDEKSDIIPLIVCSGVTPQELMLIYENIREHEDEPKSISQSLKCNGKDFDIISVLPTSDEISELIKKPFSNYEILGIPNFKKVNNDPNVVELDFTIERTDHTKSWDKNTKQFSGKVRFTKEGGSLDLNISLSHTSPETKEVVSKISKDLFSRLKSKGYIDPDQQITKVKFSDFSNESRVKFLNDLSKNQTNYELYFKDTKDIGFSPDESVTLPTEISWMQEKISNLVLQGKELHNTFFVTNKKFHKFIKIYKLEAAYTFDYQDCSGSCSVSFEFPEFISKQDEDSELTIRVLNVRFKEESIRLPQGTIKERVLRWLEKPKMTLFEENKTKKK